MLDGAYGVYAFFRNSVSYLGSPALSFAKDMLGVRGKAKLGTEIPLSKNKLEKFNAPLSCDPKLKSVVQQMRELLFRNYPVTFVRDFDNFLYTYGFSHGEPEEGGQQLCFYTIGTYLQKHFNKSALYPELYQCLWQYEEEKSLTFTPNFNMQQLGSDESASEQSSEAAVDLPLEGIRNRSISQP